MQQTGRIRNLRCWSGVVIAMCSLAGCGQRDEVPPPPPPKDDSTQLMYDLIADDAASVQAAAK